MVGSGHPRQSRRFRLGPTKPPTLCNVGATACAAPLAPRQIARHIGGRGRGSRLIPLRFTPVTPFLDQHHKMWVGPDETEQRAGGGARGTASG
jgi:hypothetical protein